MEKRSRKLASRSKKSNAGCSWCFISWFYFCRSYSTGKLLSHWKFGSGRRAATRCSQHNYQLLRHLEKLEDTDDETDGEDEIVQVDIPRVNSLVKEKISKPRLSKRFPVDEVGQMRTKLVFLLDKNQKTTSKSSKVATDLLSDLNCTNLGPHQSHCPNPLERSISNFNLAAFMLSFYSSNHQCLKQESGKGSYPSLETAGLLESRNLTEHKNVPAEKLSIIQKALSNVAETMLTQKFIDEKQTTDKEAFYQSKQFIEALEILNTNNMLLVKLIQEPDSVLLKHMQDLQNAQAEICNCTEGTGVLGEVISSLVQPEAMEKTEGTKPSKQSKSDQPAKNIVVLKPRSSRTQSLPVPASPNSSPISFCSSKSQEVSERARLYFSLKAIKRILKQAIGWRKKKWNLISMDNVLDRIPNECKVLGDIGKQRGIEKILHSKTCSDTMNNGSQCFVVDENINKLKGGSGSASMKIVDENINKLKGGSGSASMKIADHTATNMQADSSVLHRKPSLKRSLSLPTYNFLYPRSSPVGEKEFGLSPRRVILSPNCQIKEEIATNDLSPMKPIEGSFTHTNLSVELKVVDPSAAFFEAQIPEFVRNVVNLNPEGNTESVGMVNAECIEETNQKGLPLEANDTQSNVLSEACKEERYALSEFESSKEMPSPSSPIPSMPCCSLIKNIETPNNIMEKPEQPSPVSVLEPFFSEVTSPQSRNTNLSIQPQQLYAREHRSFAINLTSQGWKRSLSTYFDDEEVRDEFITAVLEASGVLSYDNSELDQLPEPSLLDEIGTLYGMLKDDSQVLLDCINEVLIEIHRRYFGFSPWMFFIKPHVRPLPKGIALIQEVRKRVDWQIKVDYPATLDQLVGKAIEGRSWMDLRHEIENIVIDIGDDILLYIMEDFILELWVELFHSSGIIFLDSDCN